MSYSNSNKLLCLIATLALGFGSSAKAGIIIAADDASDAAYSAGWSGNGGFGFGAWTFANSAGAGQFIGSSTNNGDGDGNGDQDIDTGGSSSFGLFSEASSLSEAFRNFAFGSLSTNSTFRLSLDSGFLNGAGDPGPDGSFGFGLRSGGVNRFEFFFVGGTSFYQINDSTNSNTSVGFTDEGLDLEFTLTSADTYSFTISPLGGGGASTVTGTLDGAAGSGIDNLRLFSFSNQTFPGNGASDGFFNSFSVEEQTTTTAAVPEPSSFLLLGLCVGGLVVRRRIRRNQEQ